MGVVSGKQEGNGPIDLRAILSDQYNFPQFQLQKSNYQCIDLLGFAAGKIIERKLFDGMEFRTRAARLRIRRAASEPIANFIT